MYYSISKPKEQDLVFKALQELLTIDSKDLQKENFEILSHMDKLNWIGQEELFVQLLKLKNIKLAYNLCDNFALQIENGNNPIFDIGPINWWLEWFVELKVSNNKDWIFIERVTPIITNYISKRKRQEFISEFNTPDSKYRRILSRIILRKMDDLKLDDFTEETLSYLFKELKTEEIGYFNGSILVDIATEKLVTEHMLPLLKKSKGVEYKNLEKVIEKIGRKHGRRYLL